MSKRILAILIVLITIIIDQAIKIYIKTHFYIGEEILVFGLKWFRLHFTENNGMAWGFEFGGRYGKLALTLFRVIAIGGIIYWLHDSLKRNAHMGGIIAIALILSGAIGNIIDSVFYGVIFNTPIGDGIATIFPEETYGELFFGKVVDMFYFPLYEGEDFTFFNAIFNGADSWISIGVVLLFIFQKEVFPKEQNN